MLPVPARCCWSKERGSWVCCRLSSSSRSPSRANCTPQDPDSASGWKLRLICSQRDLSLARSRALDSSESLNWECICRAMGQPCDWVRQKVHRNVWLIAEAEGRGALAEKRRLVVEETAWSVWYLVDSESWGKRYPLGKLNMALALEVLRRDLFAWAKLVFSS